MENLFKNKTVLILDGDKGLALGCAQLFTCLGAHVILTFAEPVKDGIAILESAKLKDARILSLDLTSSKSTRSSLKGVHETSPKIDILISVVDKFRSFESFESFDENIFTDELKTTTWPFFEVLIAIREIFGSCPDYAIAALEESGRKNAGTISKNMIETLSRYMATNYLYENCRVNVLRVQKSSDLGFEVSEKQAAKTIVTMCSGLLDSMSGQVLCLDKGMACAI